MHMLHSDQGVITGWSGRCRQESRRVSRRTTRPYRLIAMAMATELFHTATLVHDDVVDDSGVRRGQPTVHSLWGKGAALLLGDYLFSLSADLVAFTRNMRVIDIFADTLKTVSRGELGHNLSQAQERGKRREYYRWIGAKTASVMAAATQVKSDRRASVERAVTTPPHPMRYVGLRPHPSSYSSGPRLLAITRRLPPNRSTHWCRKSGSRSVVRFKARPPFLPPVLPVADRPDGRSAAAVAADTG